MEKSNLDWRGVQHGRLTLFVPKDWSDASRISLVAPAHVPPSAPLSPKQAAPVQRNLVVTLEATDAETGEAFVDRLLADPASRAERVSSQPMSIAGHQGVCVEVRAKGERVVRQLIGAAIVAPKVALLAVATVDEGSFERYRKELFLCLSSIVFR